MELLNNLNNINLEKKEKEIENENKKIKIKMLLNIKDRINTLEKEEYFEIYNIIRDSNEQYSVNKNGVMFDLVKLKDKTIGKINQFLKYLLDKNMQINNDEFNRNKYIELVNNKIEQ